MSSSTPDASPPDSSRNSTRAAVLTVSDSCSRGEKVDLSGPAVAKALGRRNFQVVVQSVVADERAEIQEKLIELCRSARLVVTTGGTGIAPRDVTPEATLAVADKVMPLDLYLSSNCEVQYLPTAVAEQKVRRLGEVARKAKELVSV